MREDSFQPIVSKYLHQIVGSVQRAGVRRESVSAQGAATRVAELSHDLEALPQPGQRIFLAADKVHLLTEVNTTLENIGYPDSEGWLILGKPFEHSDMGESEFFVRGVLDPDLSAYFFISLAYKAILRRMVDVDGLTNYMKMISDGRLAHAAFLAALADSPEAKQLNCAFFLTPRNVIQLPS